MTNIIKRIINTLLGIDETANAVLGGSPRQTISGTIGRAYLKGAWWASAAVYVVDLILGKGHCVRAAQEEDGTVPPAA